jgi:hypothetical protein
MSAEVWRRERRQDDSTRSPLDWLGGRIGRSYNGEKSEARARSALRRHSADNAQRYGGQLPDGTSHPWGGKKESVTRDARLDTGGGALRIGRGAKLRIEVEEQSWMKLVGTGEGMTKERVSKWTPDSQGGARR